MFGIRSIGIGIGIMAIAAIVIAETRAQDAANYPYAVDVTVRNESVRETASSGPVAVTINSRGVRTGGFVDAAYSNIAYRCGNRLYPVFANTVSGDAAPWFVPQGPTLAPGASHTCQLQLATSGGTIGPAMSFGGRDSLEIPSNSQIRYTGDFTLTLDRLTVDRYPTSLQFVAGVRGAYGIMLRPDGRLQATVPLLGTERPTSWHDSIGASPWTNAGSLCIAREGTSQTGLECGMSGTPNQGMRMANEPAAMSGLALVAPFTVGFWFEGRGTLTGRKTFINPRLNINGVSDCTFATIEFDAGDLQLHYIGDSSGGCNSGAPVSITPDPPIARGQWRHLVITASPPNASNESTVTVWLDGERALTETAVAFTENLTRIERVALMGTIIGGNRNDFALDELIVSDEVLSDGDIRALYDAAAYGSFLPPGYEISELTHRWSFNEHYPSGSSAIITPDPIPVGVEHAVTLSTDRPSTYRSVNIVTVPSLGATEGRIPNGELQTAFTSLMVGDGFVGSVYEVDTYGETLNGGVLAGGRVRMNANQATATSRTGNSASGTVVNIRFGSNPGRWAFRATPEVTSSQGYLRLTTAPPGISGETAVADPGTAFGGEIVDPFGDSFEEGGSLMWPLSILESATDPSGARGIPPQLLAAALAAAASFGAFIGIFGATRILALAIAGGMIAASMIIFMSPIANVTILLTVAAGIAVLMMPGAWERRA